VLVDAIDLEIVLQFPRPRQARVERLVGLVIAVAVMLEKAAALLGEHYRLVAVPGHPNGRDQATLAKVPQIAGAGIGRAIVVVPEVTTGDHSKGAHGRQRP
jgi:hypothetical protein